MLAHVLPGAVFGFRDVDHAQLGDAELSRVAPLGLEGLDVERAGSGPKVAIRWWPSLAALRTPRGPRAPIQIGGWGCCTGLGERRRSRTRWKRPSKVTRSSRNRRSISAKPSRIRAPRSRRSMHRALNSW